MTDGAATQGHSLQISANPAQMLKERKREVNIREILDNRNFVSLVAVGVSLKVECKFSKKNLGFTLVEILVVIAILVILAALLFPVFSRAREKARAASCLSNYHQVGIGIQMYAQDFDDRTPANGGSFGGLIQDCVPYIHSTSVFVCPDDFDRDEEGRAGSYRVPSLYQGKPLSCGWTNPYIANEVTTVSTTTLTYEAEQDFAQAPIVPTYRHSNWTQVLFFDGHAKWQAR